MSLVNDYRKKYNELLKREAKAEAYLNDPVRTPEEIDKWTPDYKQLLNRLNELLGLIRHYKRENILEGFPNI